MSDHRVKILRIEQLTPNVKSFIVEKPKGYVFHPGSHTHIKLEDSKFKDKKHPFTICSLNRDNFLEFLIKGYHYGRIDSEFLKETIKDFSQYFYLCGPKIFALEVKKMLLGLGASMEK